MKKIFLCIALLASVSVLFAQNDSLIKWTVKTHKFNDSFYSLTASTSVPFGWYLYGDNKQIEGLENLNIVFNDTSFHASSIGFKQAPVIITDAIFDNKKVSVYRGLVTNEYMVTSSKKIDGFHFNITCNISNGKEFLPQENKIDININGNNSSTNSIKINSINLQQPLFNCGDNNDAVKHNTGLLKVFLLGLFGGLIALFTPCVFPMIPVTVSFFTKKSANKKQGIKNGLLYGLFIFLIYVVASLPFHLLGNVNPEIFNNISTNAWLNILFFVIFIFFAISFFGFFEITLPSSVAGSADSKSGLGSIGGIFFMAVTLTIVSFSCTGPLLGTLLVGAINGGAWQLTAGMAGFGVALGLPFALFAIFPNWLHSLPKSGSWLDTVKKVLAFAELALAFKFLSNADLVQHWGILKREIFFALWVIISLGLAAYLFGWLRLPHDYKGQKIALGRKVLGVVALVFAIYISPGITNTKYANVSLLSGFPPPLSYSIYGKENVQGKGLEPNAINDLDKAIALAKQTGKKIMIDCTGWACVNCRKMEENVWTNPEVKAYIQEHYILVSLYVDDKKLLPNNEQIYGYTTKENLKKDILSEGDKWATFEAENFGQNTQPLYVLLNTDQQLVNHPVGYTPDAKKYLEWLKCGEN